MIIILLSRLLDNHHNKIIIKYYFQLPIEIDIIVFIILIILYGAKNFKSLSKHLYQ